MSVSRRSLLEAIAAIVASAATPLAWPEVAHAMDGVHASLPGADPKLTFFNAADAADVGAVAAQIIPSDDSPGARDEGVVYFIDRALGSVCPFNTLRTVMLSPVPDWWLYPAANSAEHV